MTDSPNGSTGPADWERALSTGSFEEVFAALEAVVAQLEEGQVPLAESVARYELGVRLAERCDRFLDEAELRVSRLEGIAAKLDEATVAHDPDLR